MSKLQRLLGVVVVLVMLLGSVGSVAIAEQGNQTGAGTQGGGQVGPNRPTPTPPPASEPTDPAPQPPSNGGGGGGTTAPPKNSSGVSAQTGGQGPARSAPQPTPPPSNNNGGGGTGPLSVIVDLSSQMAYVYRGDTQINSTAVNTGKAGFETPTGTFYINLKLRYDDMSGREGGESWDVSNVPYAMYFTNRGHALHGAPWARSFGSPRSHGCVNLPMGFAAWLWDVAPVGTKVVVRW